MICYTRSFEDVMLQRVLRDVEQGCYLDIGACAPIMDSNTFAFYERGWRGICAEPLELKDAWVKARPEDIFVNAAIGKEPGRTTIYVYQQMAQLSTTSKETVDFWEASKLKPSWSVEVPVYTINSLLERHLGGRQIHFASIDVEGMEKDVLLGFDLRKYRPWIIIIESTMPGTQTPCHENWESLITESGYSMAYSDSVNRFYLANEKADLLERFRFPPNAFDRFELAATIEANRKCALLEMENEKLNAELAQYKNTVLPKRSQKRSFNLFKFFTDLKF